ncbi:3'(2'),5'-bisphosphate nucleotidase CysQ [Teredinibacter sp. KSP-S5-2]|uniref:3'(2'),5'-bisphosphate nucleotidase CysQ n=1 Tax=Teredinibacter sp. KSP-S5-2 TaxID=3034506 RepID=UPI002934BEDA|nr:3'(2'),5'-bisphosphate nucleotidase CysQ [Teredinibacter sp. KSP-S5-2]WNO09367.1 3'(2'),5'-bisphosphate nucleotidase CysQ [Teredinibacter sp. KSP-S5-2]
MIPELNRNLLTQVSELCKAAGKAALHVYNRPNGELDVATKADQSPVTEADLASNAVLVEGLERILPGVPILSEEIEYPDFSIRSQWSCYWLIDPLDGTKEFINRNGEFTINVALIQEQKAVLGVVYAPVLDVSYMGLAGQGAWKQISEGSEQLLSVRPLAGRGSAENPVEIVASRRHGAEAVEQLIERLCSRFGEVDAKSMGSSLKLCLVAEGKADIYPRLAPTCEWDTAAAQAVVEAAGGIVLDNQLNQLKYNAKEELLNPHFYVLGDKNVSWSEILLG